ncbi:hypothetical protein [Streptosporangium sp. V21-05]|uniref:hypothetical protein n=1 Tax=Streptosporangium sp. V21-05 TaxID=3446115 RepID=UPI003F533657
MNERASRPRRGGRHRRGAATAQVGSRLWDLAERAAAEGLDRIEPAWTVWYGTAPGASMPLPPGPPPSP